MPDDGSDTLLQQWDVLFMTLHQRLLPHFKRRETPQRVRRLLRLCAALSGCGAGAVAQRVLRWERWTRKQLHGDRQVKRDRAGGDHRSVGEQQPGGDGSAEHYRACRGVIGQFHCHHGAGHGGDHSRHYGEPEWYLARGEPDHQSAGCRYGFDYSCRV